MERFVATFQLIREAALLFLLATTASFAFAFISDFAAQFSWWPVLSGSFVLLATFVVCYMVDGLFGLLLGISVRMLMGEKISGVKTKYAKALKVVVTAGALVFGLLTGGLSWMGSEEIANVSVTRQDTHHLTESIRTNNSKHEANMARIERDLNEARRTQVAREAAAIRKGKQLVAAASALGSKEYQRAWRTSRGWVMSRRGKKYATLIAYREGILAAEADATTLLATERGKIGPLEDALLRGSTAGMAEVHRVDSALAATALALVQGDSERIESRATGIIIADIVAVLVAFLLTFLIQMCDVPARVGKHDFATIVSNNFFVLRQWAMGYIDVASDKVKDYHFVGAAAGAGQGHLKGSVLPPHSAPPTGGPASPHAPPRPRPTPLPHKPPVGTPRSVPPHPHSPTGSTAGANPTAPHSPAPKTPPAIPTDPNASKTAAPRSPGGGAVPTAPTADPTEIGRVDKRCRRRYDLFKTYTRQATDATDATVKAERQALADQKWTDYLEDKEWLEFNGRRVFINSRGTVTVEKA